MWIIFLPRQLSSVSTTRRGRCSSGRCTRCWTDPRPTCSRRSSWWTISPIWVSHIIPCGCSDSQCKWAVRNISQLFQKLYFIYRSYAALSPSTQFPPLLVQCLVFNNLFFFLVLRKGIVHDVCVTEHHQYKDVSNQRDATPFSFINLFNSALHVSGDKFAHPQVLFLTVYTAFGTMHRHCCRSVPRLRWN